MKVKICGITNYNDAKAALDFGADALGFVFYKHSPRFVEPQQAQQIISKLPPFIEKTALFVNESADTINELCHFTKATLAQIHFDADSLLYKQLNVPYLKVIRAQAKEEVMYYPDEYALVDAYCESYGGSGKRLHLDWFSKGSCQNRILAGGLTPENIDEIKGFDFYGVDVSSGVEKEKGLKDYDKLQRFISKAKSF